MLSEEQHINGAAWQIDHLEKLLARINKDPGRVLCVILDMQSLYTRYSDKANIVDKKRNDICTRALGLEQKLHISNGEREQADFLLPQQTIKIIRYEKMIDGLQSSLSWKLDILLSSIKKSID